MFEDAEESLPVIKRELACLGYVIEHEDICRAGVEECALDGELPTENLPPAEELPLEENGEAPGPRGPAITDYSLTVSGTFDGQLVQYILYKNTLSSIDFLNLFELRKTLKPLLKFPLAVADNGNREEVENLEGLLDLATKLGRKGLTIQRYKGLGEMNPEQLWSTTMNPETRTLQQVKLNDVVEADRIFTVLMGDEVEPRRKFIQENAFNVRNLDV